MKHINKWILGAAAMTLSMSFTACTDDFDETNRDPNNLNFGSIKAEYVFPGVVYNSMKGLQEINFRYVVSLARYNVHWFEQKEAEDTGEKMVNIYKNGLADLAMLERAYADKEGTDNVKSMLDTYKSYVYYLLVTSYGNVPMSDAVTPEIQQHYKYDTQEEIYNVLLTTLDKAVATFDINGDKINKDPLFGGDISKWRAFANSLRLQVALTIQNSDPELAEQHIHKAFEGENANYFLTDDAQYQFGTDLSNDASWVYNAYTKDYDAGSITGWGTYGAMSHNFYLYMGSYNDPRLSKFTQPAEGNTRARLANDTIIKPCKGYDDLAEKWVVERYRIPYSARFDYKERPVGWQVGTDPNSSTGEEYKSATDGLTKGTNECLVSYDFMKRDAIMPMLSVAEVNFMKAEVAVKYPGVVSGTAEEYYNAGVRASMTHWGVSAADAEAYLAQDGVKWDTDGDGLYEYRGFYKADIKGHGGDEAHLEQIYKQWYIADFFNGFAGWTLERRTRVMNFPPHFYNGSPATEGSNQVCDWMMERLQYAVSERASNTEAWSAAVEGLQKECPWWAKDVYRTAYRGDNFFTLLRFAKPQPQSIDDWFEGNVYVNGEYMQESGHGVIRYHREFLRQPYGKTYEEICENVGKLFGVTINASNSNESTKQLEELIDWKLAKTRAKLFEKSTGYNVQTDRKGNPKYKEDGTYLYEGEEEE